MDDLAAEPLSSGVCGVHIIDLDRNFGLH
jgi:hypothetical protein